MVERIKAEEAKKANEKKSDSASSAKASTTVQNSSAGSSASTQPFQFQMPQIHFHANSLMNGTGGGIMFSPSKAQATAPKMSQSSVSPSAMEAIPAKTFPLVRDFLATIDVEEMDIDENPNYSQYADKLVEKGYRRIHLLLDETPKSLQLDLGLSISMGDAKQMLLHIKRACNKIARAARAAAAS